MSVVECGAALGALLAAVAAEVDATGSAAPAASSARRSCERARHGSERCCPGGLTFLRPSARDAHHDLRIAGRPPGHSRTGPPRAPRRAGGGAGRVRRDGAVHRRAAPEGRRSTAWRSRSTAGREPWWSSAWTCRAPSATGSWRRGGSVRPTSGTTAPSCWEWRPTWARAVWHVYEDLGDRTLDTVDPDWDGVDSAIDLIAELHVRFAEHPLSRRPGCTARGWAVPISRRTSGTPSAA